MVANIVNVLSRALVSQKTNQPTNIKPVSQNPFANPFMSESSNVNFSGYAKNKPIQGGYFAGYYNGKPNIVGQHLFIEV